MTTGTTDILVYGKSLDRVLPRRRHELRGKQLNTENSLVPLVYETRKEVLDNYEFKIWEKVCHSTADTYFYKCKLKDLSSYMTSSLYLFGIPNYNY